MAMFESPPVDRLAALSAAERMYDGPVPADWRCHILRGGRHARVTPVARARAHVRSRIALLRRAPAWQRAQAHGWLADALAGYRAAQAHGRGVQPDPVGSARCAVRAALTRAADWRAAHWRGRLTGHAYRAVAQQTGLAALLRRYRELQRTARI
jgi:hypothetical protein